MTTSRVETTEDDGPILPLPRAEERVRDLMAELTESVTKARKARNRMSAPVCFVDTETLGLDPDHHPIWEVGLITDDGHEFEWQLHVTEREKSLAHPIALEMTHFEERYGKGNIVTPAKFVQDFWAMTRGCHLAGAVISFDEERLRRLLWRHGLSPQWHYHLIDVEALAIGFLAGRGTMMSSPEDHVRRPPWKSDELTAALGITVPEESKHTAMGDARWAKAIYEAVLGG